MLVDCHVHLWDLKNNWSWPTSENKVLYQNYLVPEFLESSSEVTDRKCILVQVRQLYEETDWYLKFAEENDFIVGAVGWVDLKDKDGKVCELIDSISSFKEISHTSCFAQDGNPDQYIIDDGLKERLTTYKANPYFCGVRHIVQDEPNIEWLLDEKVLKGLALLEEMGITYDLLILEKHMEVAEKVVQMFPKLTFVIDHLAKPSIDKNDLEIWTQKMKTLAAFPNVNCKISGLGDLADPTSCLKTQIVPYIKKTIELFGSERCLFGSDWPVCLQAITYKDWYDLVKLAIADLPAEDRDNILFKTALRVYVPKV